VIFAVDFYFIGGQNGVLYNLVSARLARYKLHFEA